jgi:hypothetical protein
MPDDRKDEDIRELMTEEKSRGRRPYGSEAIRAKKKQLEDFRTALTLKTEQDFVKAIRELWYVLDPDQLEDAVRVWRSLSSSRL